MRVTPAQRRGNSGVAQLHRSHDDRFPKKRGQELWCTQTVELLVDTVLLDVPVDLCGVVSALAAAEPFGRNLALSSSPMRDPGVALAERNQHGPDRKRLDESMEQRGLRGRDWWPHPQRAHVHFNRARFPIVHVHFAYPR